MPQVIPPPLILLRSVNSAVHFANSPSNFEEFSVLGNVSAGSTAAPDWKIAGLVSVLSEPDSSPTLDRLFGRFAAIDFGDYHLLTRPLFSLTRSARTINQPFFSKPYQCGFE
jgi:hypothetical protein